MVPVTLKVTAAKQKDARRNDLIGSVILGFIVGFKALEAVLHFNDLVNDPQHFLLSARGNFLGGLLVAAALGYFKYRENNKKPVTSDITEVVHPYQIMGNLTMIAAIAGLLGAKIFHNLENWDEFTKDPIDALLSFSGLTFYGGLICGGAAVLYQAAKYKVHWKHMLDIGAPAMMLAYAVGRIGCHVSGDGDWGIVNTAPKPGWLSWAPDWLWAYNYPNNVIEQGVPIDGCVGKYCSQLPEMVFPTPLYEFLACLALFGVIWALRKRIKVPGVLFGVYLMMNGIERFCIEKIRVNNKMDFLGMDVTQAEIIAAALFLIGLGGIVWLLNSSRPPKPSLT